MALLDGLGVTKADRSPTGITVEEEHDHTGHTVPVEAGEQAITASIEATFALVLG